jgi:uncharacterized repeat protein (TIGR02543 family)
MITLRMYSIVRQTATSDVHCYHRSQTSDRGLDAYYLVDDELDITGLIVDAMYSDGSTQTETITAQNISGFDSETIGVKTLTVTIGEETDTFTVTVYAVAIGNLVSIAEPEEITVINGAAKTAAGLNLPGQVVIEVEVDDDNANVSTVADVTWDVEAATYDPETKTVQTVSVTGTVTLPEEVGNTDDISLEVTATVTVSAATYTVSFNLNGQSGASIPPQTVDHGSYAAVPTEPTSVSHTFNGWYTDANAGSAWVFGSDAVEQDIDLYARWTIKTYTITFIATSPGATGIPLALTVEHGNVATKPANPVLAGSNFVAWYTDEGLETAYDWSAAVTASFTLHAKFADALSAAKDDLTFDVIRGANTSEQGILTNLGLPVSLTAHPGVAISWTSNNSAIQVSGTSGIVTRPDAADAAVTLTATLTFNGGTGTKEFNLIVRQKSVANIEVTGTDTRFAPGYPIVSFDNDGKATLKIKLDPGTATAESPVWAYLVFDAYGGTGYTLDRESILYGHCVSTREEGGKRGVLVPSRIGELQITGDEEFTYTTEAYTWNSSNLDNFKIGVVLLKDDNINDPASTATLISLSAEEIGYIDVSPPSSFDVFLSEDNKTIYAYCYERLSTSADNTPDSNDFALYSNDKVYVTSVTIDNAPDDYDYMQGRVTLTLSEAITDTKDLQLLYTPGAKLIADVNSNVLRSSLYIPVSATSPAVKASYINPTAGTMMVYFEPGLHAWNQYGNYELLNTAVSLTYKGSPVAGVTHVMNSWLSLNGTGGYYTFDPLLSSGAYNTSDFELSIESGLRSWSMRTFEVVVDQPVTHMLPKVTDTGTTAVYDESKSRIVLTLPDGTILPERRLFAACNFVLSVNGKRLLYRAQVERSDPSDPYESIADNVVFLPLTDRLKAAIQTGTVTLSYDPDRYLRGGMHLSDISGAYIPAFDPVTVNVN